MTHISIKLFSFLIIFLVSFSINAQTASDALRFSQHTSASTARTIGIGGAINALGADFSVLSSNPAGLASYRSSEVSFTPSQTIMQSDAILQGDGNSNIITNKSKIGFNNIGLVFFHKPRKEGTRWKTFNLGIGFNRINEYFQDVNYEGEIGGSLADSYAEQSVGLSSDQLDSFGAGLGWSTGAIYDSDEDLNYSTDFQGLYDVPVNRAEEILYRGSINEVVLSLAGNYNEKLMIGATVGIPILSYSQERNYTENDTNSDAIPFFNSLTYEEQVTTTGTGVNLKLGAIFRASQMLRFGASIHTPTRFRLTDDFESSLAYDFTDANNDDRFEASSPEGNFSYRLVTPWKALGSVAVIIKRHGFISAEAEWVNYGNAAFNFNINGDNTENENFARILNNEITDIYKSVLNFRLGGEYAIKNFRIRAGYAINGSPFASETSINGVLSAGLGLRVKKFFIDLGYRRNTTEVGYLPYTTEVAPQPFVSTNSTRNQYLLSVGFKF